MAKTITVHGVLAGAYRGKDIAARALLTHASADGGETSLCRRVKAGSLCDAVEPGKPTCPECARRMAAAATTDCGTPTRTATCRAHNVHDCAVCIKAAGACDWGGCHTHAAVRARCFRANTGAVVETRPLCISHLVTFTSMTDGGRWAFESTSL